MTSEELTTDDLIDLKTSRIVRPRPPTLTSIPSLLSVFQNEWDALALETYTLRQELAQTRQELSTALYQNDAAVRVVARLSRERDEARDALSKITANGTSTSNGDAMQVDGQGLSDGLVSKITATQERCVNARDWGADQHHLLIFILGFQRQDGNELCLMTGQHQKPCKISRQNINQSPCILVRNLWH